MTQPLINSDEVMLIFNACCSMPVDANNILQVDGILKPFIFNKTILDQHKEQIRTWLAALPEQFQAEQGGGWSFLNACNDKNNVLWTGFHHVMDKLFCLGIALGLADYCLPREYWKSLPGEVPYIVIYLKGKPLG